MVLGFEIGKFAQPDVSLIASRKGVTEGEKANAYEACQEDALNGEIAKSAGLGPLRRDCRRVSAPRLRCVPISHEHTHRYILHLRLTDRRAVNDSRRGGMNIDCGGLLRGVCGMPIRETAFGACSEYIYLDGQHRNFPSHSRSYPLIFACNIFSSFTSWVSLLHKAHVSTAPYLRPRPSSNNKNSTSSMS